MIIQLLQSKALMEFISTMNFCQPVVHLYCRLRCRKSIHCGSFSWPAIGLIPWRVSCFNNWNSHLWEVLPIFCYTVCKSWWGLSLFRPSWYNFWILHLLLDGYSEYDYESLTKYFSNLQGRTKQLKAQLMKVHAQNILVLIISYVLFLICFPSGEITISVYVLKIIIDQEKSCLYPEMNCWYQYWLLLWQ